MQVHIWDLFMQAYVCVANVKLNNVKEKKQNIFLRLRSYRE